MIGNTSIGGDMTTQEGGGMKLVRWRGRDHDLSPATAGHWTKVHMRVGLTLPIFSDPN